MPSSKNFSPPPRHGFALAATSSDGNSLPDRRRPRLGAFLGVEHGGPSGWIDELYVAPEHRGKGIGSLLVTEVIRVAKSRGWRALDPRSHSKTINASSPLYQRHGSQPHTCSRYYLKLRIDVRM